MTDNNQKKCALVTGAAKGIGSVIAHSLATAGFNIVITENRTSAAETAKKITETGVSCEIVQGDVSDSEVATEAVKTCINMCGRVDVLVNNAGITDDSLLLRLKKEAWDNVISTNLTGTFNFTKAASKYMIKQRAGRIINITSIIGVTGNPGQANYAASKAGIIGFTKSVSRELGSRGVTANAVAPGYIVTDMTDAISEKAKEDIVSAIPLKRLGTPKDIAECVCFLASEGASYITGQVIHVNGGMYM